ncbi:hypothetical protein J7U46_09640 [Pelomonas sp. V22]|uniref:hypothetical protein n=1 Tax=Pelomonas sp. V22 TaxID=2822139 RepID=UPI0024A89AD2|nr:hypothetical protein [Pelomonas sp. V22]MDI4633308.1 hypothetical protein [Pelomonas sp. V22]
MTCPDCTRSQAEMWHGFRSGCKGCQARAASRGPQFFESREAKRQTSAYRRLIESLNLTHQQVLDAYQSDAIRQKGSK